MATATSAAFVSSAPAAWKPSPTVPTRAATRPARSLGLVSAVASSKASGRSGTSAGDARPGNSGSGVETLAISSALAAAARALSGERSFAATTPWRPSFTTRTRTSVSSRHVLWWMAECANRVSPPHWWRKTTSTPSAPWVPSAASATRRTRSEPMSSGTSYRTPICTFRKRAGAVA